MNRKMRERLIRSIVLIMVLLMLVACGKNPDVEGSVTEQTSEKANESTEDNADDVVVNDNVDISEHVDLTLGVFCSPINGEFGLMTDPVSEYLNDKFNITISTLDASDGSDWGTRLSSAMATNDLPDIFLLDSIRTQLPLLLEANMILPMDEYYENETIAPFMSSDPLYQASITLHRISDAQYTDDGKVYTIGMCRGPSGSGINPLVGNYIRWDLYAEMGYPEISTPDDMLQVLKDMQDRYPTNADDQKCYAIGAWFGDGQGWGDWLMTSLMWTDGIFTATADKTLTFDRGTGLNNEINNLRDPDGQFWRQIDFFYKANQMGILDPESFTQTSDIYTEKVNAARYYWVAAGWHPAQFQAVYDQAGMSDIGFAYIPMNGEGTNRQLDTDYVAGERNYVISAQTKDPDRCVMLMDYLQSYEGSLIGYNGLPGKYWDYVDGVPKPFPEFYDGSVDDDTMKSETGWSVYHHFVGSFNGLRNPSNGIPNALAYTPEAIEATLSKVQKDQMQHFEVTDLAEFYASGTQAPKVAGYSLGELPEELKTYADNLSTYNFTESFKIIMAKDDAEYNQLREAYLAGLDQFKADEIFEYWKSRTAEINQDIIDANELYYSSLYKAD